MNEIKKIRVGITGQSGFIGSNLFNFLGTKKDEIERVEFKDEYFYDDRLVKFVSACDVIVHLAGVNRSADSNILYKTNIDLVQRLINATEEINYYPHIIFSSSTQEQRDNAYGRSKYDGRKIFEDWAQKHNSVFSGLILPNVFGPFGKPYFNSFIATFCYQLTHKENPKIESDDTIKLIYAADVAEYIYNILSEKKSITHYVAYITEKKVSEILELLGYYKEIYLCNNIIPGLADHFEISLFNTFRSFVDYDRYKVKIKKHTDARGYLVENIKEYTGGQTFSSVTLPGITRGNHFHTRKIERFCVLQGEGVIKLRKVGTKEIVEIHVSGDDPSTIDIPIWHTHNITNTGNSNMLTLFWSNEIFNPDNPDTFFEEV